MALNNIKLELSYASDSANLVNDFYVPCMKESIFYRRAVGYFTSSGLSLAAQGIAHLLKNNGKIQLIASPHLTAEDVLAIESGYKTRETAFFDIAAKSLKEIESSLVQERLNTLAWLIASGGLDVQLAIRIDDEGRIKRGIFHEKMGVFSDSLNNHVAFSGSANETSGGLVENYEAIDVFWSWEDPQLRVADKLRRFELLWGNKTTGLDIIDFTDASKELLAAFKMEYPPLEDPAEKISHTKARSKNSVNDSRQVPVLPVEIILRDYQKLAVKNWIENKGRGTFKMATGTGKTITALAIASELFTKIALQSVIIICPYRHLVTQWALECQKFRLNPVLAFEKRSTWEGLLTSALYSLSQGSREFVCLITTNKTFASPEFQAKLKYFPQKTLLIADEAHNLGAQHLRKCLPESIGLRLALSATPERWFDEIGTDEIFKYFGSVLEPQLTIKEAIANKALVPYRYYPILVELTENEREEYLVLSENIAKAFLVGSGDKEDNPNLTMLLAKRSRLIASASNKQQALRELMINKKDESHFLFYCGDGTVEDPVSNEEERQVEVVCKILGSELGMRVNTYTAETSVEDRVMLQRRLDVGDLQGLVAIRCLDEGVDIPSIKTAVILASSRNPRQFIQRRGRILRRALGKDSAEIFDMIVIPPNESVASESERTLLRNELTRFAEFADLALNAGEARLKILDIQKRFDLMDI